MAKVSRASSIQQRLMPQCTGTSELVSSACMDSSSTMFWMLGVNLCIFIFLAAVPSFSTNTAVQSMVAPTVAAAWPCALLLFAANVIARAGIDVYMFKHRTDVGLRASAKVAIIRKQQLLAGLAQLGWASWLLWQGGAVVDIRVMAITWSLPGLVCWQCCLYVCLADAKPIVVKTSRALLLACTTLMPLIHIVGRPLLEPVVSTDAVARFDMAVLVATVLALWTNQLLLLAFRAAARSNCAPRSLVKQEAQTPPEYTRLFIATLGITCVSALVSLFVGWRLLGQPEQVDNTTSLLFTGSMLGLHVGGNSIAPYITINMLRLAGARDKVQADTADLHNSLRTQTHLLRWMSHEVRIPCQMLQLSLDSVQSVLQSAELDSSTARAVGQDLQSAQDHASQVVAILTSSLDQARAEHDKQTHADEQMDIVDVNLLAALHASLRSAVPACRAKQATVQLSGSWMPSVVLGPSSQGSDTDEQLCQVSIPLDAPLPTNLPSVAVRIPWLRVNQLLLNLVSNSLKYQQELNFDTTERVPPNIHVHVHVAEAACSSPRGAAGAASASGAGGTSLPPLARRPVPAKHMASSVDSAAGMPLLMTLSVEDNGRGMTAEEQDSLMEPFAQLRESDRQRGSGLGLFLAAEWLQSQGGSIHAYSRGVNQGSTFTVKLPLLAGDASKTVCSPMHSMGLSIDTGSKADSSDPSPGVHLLTPRCYGPTSRAYARTLNSIGSGPRARHCAFGHNSTASVPVSVITEMPQGPASSFGSGGSSSIAAIVAPNAAPGIPAATTTSSTAVADEQASSSTSLRVLVVDDTAPIRKLLVRTIQRLAPDAVTCACASGESALVALKAADQPYDLVLLDRNMPGMGGLEAAELISQLSPRTDIVGLTGQADGAEVCEFMQAGAVQVLTKPVNSEQLGEVLDSALRVKISPMSQPQDSSSE